METPFNNVAGRDIESTEFWLVFPKRTSYKNVSSKARESSRSTRRHYISEGAAIYLKFPYFI